MATRTRIVDAKGFVVVNGANMDARQVSDFVSHYTSRAGEFGLALPLRVEVVSTEPRPVVLRTVR